MQTIHQGPTKPTGPVIKMVAGEEYPIDLPFEFRVSTGAVLDLFRGGNILLINLPRTSELERYHVDNSDAECGVICDGPLLKFVFKIGELIFDPSFDIRKISADELEFNPEQFGEEDRLLVRTLLIDGMTNVLQSIRVFTLPKEVTKDVVAHCESQKHSEESCEPYELKYQQIELEDMPKYAKMYKVGS